VVLPRNVPHDTCPGMSSTMEGSEAASQKNIADQPRRPTWRGRAFPPISAKVRPSAPGDRSPFAGFARFAGCSPASRNENGPNRRPNRSSRFEPHFHGGSRLAIKLQRIGPLHGNYRVAPGSHPRTRALQAPSGSGSVSAWVACSSNRSRNQIVQRRAAPQHQSQGSPTAAEPNSQIRRTPGQRARERVATANSRSSRSGEIPPRGPRTFPSGVGGDIALVIGSGMETKVARNLTGDNGKKRLKPESVLRCFGFSVGRWDWGG
jgi:hypothetical protein